MPLYEYECQSCHRRTEKIQKFSDAELTICPHCGGPLERTITAPAFQFAGGGWYADGYGSKKPADSGSASSGDTASAAPDTSSANPATPAPAPAAAPSTPAPAATPSAKS
jgi:putative FmdB family regulatory protein